jgi:hypothetical protein
MGITQRLNVKGKAQKMNLREKKKRERMKDKGEIKRYFFLLEKEDMITRHKHR